MYAQYVYRYLVSVRSNTLTMASTVSTLASSSNFLWLGEEDMVSIRLSYVIVCMIVRSYAQPVKYNTKHQKHNKLRVSRLQG